MRKRIINLPACLSHWEMTREWRRNKKSLNAETFSELSKQRLRNNNRSKGGRSENSRKVARYGQSKETT